MTILGRRPRGDLLKNPFCETQPKASPAQPLNESEEHLATTLPDRFATHCSNENEVGSDAYRRETPRSKYRTKSCHPALLRKRSFPGQPARPRVTESACANLGGGAQDEGLLPLSPAGPIQAALGNVFNYISQKPLRPWPSGSVSGSGDRIWLSHTQAVLVTMEEIGILVEKAQVWWGRARGEGWGWAATCLGSLVTAGVSPWVWVI